MEDPNRDANAKLASQVNAATREGLARASTGPHFGLRQRLWEERSRVEGAQREQQRLWNEREALGLALDEAQALNRLVCERCDSLLREVHIYRRAIEVCTVAAIAAGLAWMIWR